MKENKTRTTVYLKDKTIETLKKAQLQHMKTYGEVLTYSDIINQTLGGEK